MFYSSPFASFAGVLHVHTVTISLSDNLGHLRWESASRGVASLPGSVITEEQSLICIEGMPSTPVWKHHKLDVGGIPGTCLGESLDLLQRHPTPSQTVYICVDVRGSCSGDTATGLQPGLISSQERLLETSALAPHIDGQLSVCVA